MRPLCCAWMRVTRPRVAAPGCRHCKHRGVYTQLTPADRPTSRHPSSLPLDLTPTRLRILFFGSDAFSLPTLQLLSARPPSSSSPPPRVAVVCPPAQAGVSRRAREPLPVLAHAQQQHLSVFPVPDTVPFRMDGWEVPASPFEGAFDVGVVASFGYFIPRRVIASFPLGMINLHPSLLPRWRGASPIQHALLHGDDETGVSIIDLHPTRMDAGNVLLQLSEPVAPDDTYASLAPRLATLGARAILHAINHIGALRASSLAQPSSSASAALATAPKLTAAFGRVDFALPASAVYQRYRACKGFLPCYTTWKGQRVSIVEVRGIDAAASSVHPTGSSTWERGTKALRVQCGDGRGLLVTALQLAGGKVMDASSFANGYLLNAEAGSVRFGDGAVVEGASERRADGERHAAFVGGVS